MSKRIIAWALIIVLICLTLDAIDMGINKYKHDQQKLRMEHDSLSDHPNYPDTGGISIDSNHNISVPATIRANY